MAMNLKQLTIEELSELTAKILSEVTYTNEITTVLDLVTEQQTSQILTLAAISSLRKVCYHQVIN